MAAPGRTSASPADARCLTFEWCWGKTFTVLDVYTKSTTSFVSLYIAYFPSQRTSDTIHSPKNCLPGAGGRRCPPTR